LVLVFLVVVFRVEVFDVDVVAAVVSCIAGAVELAV